MSNIWKHFRSLIEPTAAKIYGQITAVDPSGTIYTITTHTGSSMRAKGSGYSIGDRVFVIGSEIKSKAPVMPYYEFEV